MLSLITLLMLVHLTTSAQDIHYVKPDDSSLLHVDCPSQPCLSLKQYAEQVDRYFTAGVTFVFLEGIHSLRIPLELTHVSNLSLTGVRHNSSISIINTEYISLFNATNIDIERLRFGRSNTYKSALIFNNCDSIYISESVFLSGKPSASAVLSSNHSNITITNCLFKGNTNTGIDGGAISIKFQTNLRLIGSNFTRNIASLGGAIFASESTLSLEGTVLKSNLCSKYCNKNGAGAIYCIKCTVNITGKCYFGYNNGGIYGGALSINFGRLAITGVARFYKNEGPIYLNHSYARIKGKNIRFIKNRGGLHMESSQNNYFEEKNMSSNNCSVQDEKTLISAYFSNNKDGLNQGVIHVSRVNNVIFQNLRLIDNTRAVYIQYSSVQFEGTNKFINNKKAMSISFGSNIVLNGNTIIYKSGGVTTIKSKSSASFKGYTLFHDNNGGAIESDDGMISFTGTTIFTNNTSSALYALNTEITMEGNVNFSFNSARNGAGMRLKGTSSLTFAPYTTLYSSYNTADDYGGVIYHEDVPTDDQCQSKHFSKDLESNCFLQFATRSYNILLNIYSWKDTAGKDGSFLYGGLLDRCEYRQKSIVKSYTSKFKVKDLFRKIIKIHLKDDDTTRIKGVTSQPYKLCFCNSDHTYKCGNTKRKSILRGQKFIVSILALGQNDSITPTVITAVIGQNARLSDNYQSRQFLPMHCSDLTYSIYSKENKTSLTLYPDGPCHDIGTARMVVNVALLPCPDAFTQEGEQCVCEERLQAYGANCTIGNRIMIIRQAGSKFWMQFLYRNNFYEGLILYHTCPTDYCTTKTVAITLDNLDIQCDHNHTGILCGACAANYSLLLGSSRCDVCSHHYLALLIPFALAGVVLVVFLSCLRLTVATGIINSLILYANFIQANKIIFFPSNEINILTVFIAWLNLDLGFETCFIPGLDAYTQTWLQFAFPLYVWILIGLIIFSSRYSITISKYLGRNPIAVLATLILMSYTKILKIIIGTFSSVKLDYPRRYNDVSVWLKDANVPYLQSKHLALSVVTLLILVVLFVPYTILLLTGPCLYRVSHRRCYFFLRRIKPLLDSYYAPYKKNTRYWTGFLLLVRCALYVVFSFNSLGGTNNSLLAIIVTFTAIGLIPWYIGRIYKKLYMDVVEGSVYLNLIVLSAGVAIIAEDKKRALVYTLIAIMFTTTIINFLHQFYLLYIAKTATWQKMKAKIPNCLQKQNNNNNIITPESTAPAPVPMSSLELREPLLES